MFWTILIIYLSHLSYALADTCQEPAMKPTILIGTTSYQYGAQFQVQEGSEFLAKCEQTGAKKLNITCGSSGNIFQSNYAYDPVVSLPPVFVNRTMTGQQCTCYALQQSDCYTVTIITLNVTYPSEITMLTANGKNSIVEVSLNEPLHFICTAIGNPIPVLYMTHETPTSTPFVSVQTYLLDHEIQAKCTDTDLYYCVSNNNINTGTLASKQKPIQVYVKCATKVVTNTDSYSVKLGSTAEVRIPITAYPNPNTFALYTPLGRPTFDKPVDSSKYNITFIPGTAPKGTIVVYIYSTTREDLIQYKLDIVNGVSGASPYNFKLTEKKDDLTVGEIVGIAVGVIAGVAIIIIVIAVIICNKNKPRSPIHSKKPEGVYDSATYNSPYVIGYERPKLAQSWEYENPDEQYDTIPADMVDVEDVYVGETPNDTAVYMQPLPDQHSFTYGGSVYSQTTDSGVLPGAGPHSSTYGGSVYSQATDVTNLPGDSNNSFSRTLLY